MRNSFIVNIKSLNRFFWRKQIEKKMICQINCYRKNVIILVQTIQKVQFKLTQFAKQKNISKTLEKSENKSNFVSKERACVPRPFCYLRY